MPGNGGDATGMDPDISSKWQLARPVVDAGMLDEHVGRVQCVAEQDEACEGQHNSVSHVVPSCGRWGTLQAEDKKHQLSAVKIWVRVVDRPKVLDEQSAKIPAALNPCHDDLFAVLRLSAPK
jgi:hypothetical protein